MRKSLLASGLAACSFVLAGCDGRGCVLIDDLMIWIATRYDAICAHGDGDWDGRLAELQREYSGLSGMMMAAKSADRAGEKQLAGEMRAGLYRRLVGRVSGGYRAIEGSIASGGDVRNVFPALDPSDAIRVRAISGAPLEAVAPVPTVLVGSRGYLQEAAGAAAAIGKAENGVVPAFGVDDPGIDSPETSYFFAGGSVAVRVGGIGQTHSLERGVLRVAEVADGAGTRLVPSGFEWALSHGGVSTTVTLDPACPYNEVAYTDADHGVVRMGVVIDGESAVVDRLEWLGTVWVTLPFSVGGDGSIDCGTGGWVGSAELVPASDVALAVLAGDGVAPPASLPNGPAEVCADADGNGIRDGADAMNWPFDYYIHDCE